MEGSTEFHRVDHDRPVRQLKPDDLKQVARAVGADDQNPGWVEVEVGFEVDDHDRVFERVNDRGVIDAVLVG